MRKLAALPPAGESFDQLWQILSRFDRADIEDEAIGEVVALSHTVEHRPIANRLKRRSGRFVHHVDPLGL